MTKKLIDFSYARPGAKNIKEKGYDGICRYLSFTPGKTLTLDECNSYLSEGLHITLVWETTANRSLGGKMAGILDATEAQKQAKALGFENPTIYFAVDFDSTPAQQTQIDSYLRGCANVIGKQSVGVYGSYYVIERCFSNVTANWFWQTLAWSGGQVSKHNHIYQNGKADFNGSVDVDDAVDNWGYCTLPRVESTYESVKTPEIVVNEPPVADTNIYSTLPHPTPDAPQAPQTFVIPETIQSPTTALNPVPAPNNSTNVNEVPSLVSIPVSDANWFKKLINLIKTIWGKIS